MPVSPRFGYQYLSEGQAGADIVLNSIINQLETLNCLYVLSRSTTTPAVSPSNGDAYILPSGATGIWGSKTNKIAYYYDGWYYITPKDALEAYVADESQSVMYSSTATNWCVKDGAYKTLSYSSTITVNSLSGDSTYVHMTLTGNVAVTLGNGLRDGQRIRFRFKQDGTGSRTLTMSTAVALGTTFTSTTLTTTANKTDILVLEWNVNLTKWVVVEFIKGF